MRVRAKFLCHFGEIIGKKDEYQSQEINNAPFSSEKACCIKTEAESPMVVTEIRRKLQHGGHDRAQDLPRYF